MKKLTKSKKFWQSVCGCGFVFSLGIIALSTCLLLKKDKDSFSNVEGDGSYVTIGELSTTDEEGNVIGFDKNNMQLLLDMLSNEENTNFEKIDQLAGLRQTSEDFRLNTINKEANQDIVVTLGGLEWQVMYLSQAKEKEDGSSDTILTLWLSNSTQKAWQDENGENRSDLKSDQGKYYGFGKGGLYSQWSANWWNSSITDKKADFYPSSMYGTSYIRVVTLNNGGVFATNNTSLSTEYQKNSNSVFAKFNMEDVTGSLTDYIVKPEQVAWQENQSAIIYGFPYNISNDAWSTDTPDEGFYTGGNLNYAEHDHYEDWKDDYIWLPSYTELYAGSKGSDTGGMWKTSPSQRSNYDGITENPSAAAGGG